MTRLTTLCKNVVTIYVNKEKNRMFSIKIIVVGKVKEEYLRKKIDELVGTIRKKCNIELIELDDESIPKNAGESIMSLVKEKEGKRILENINNQDYVIALCIDGKTTGDVELANIFSDRKKNDTAHVDFIIGGSLGLSDDVVKRANYKLSFSKMTFPHQLMRVMLLEQIDKTL